MTSGCSYCSNQFDVQEAKILTECTTSNGEPCLACERQVKIRKRIEETKKLLDALIIEEREARTEMNAIHDPFQAHRLPVEIASYIFRFTLPPFTLQKLSYSDGHPVGQNRHEYCNREALTLGAVCRAWRQIAWSTPQLWSDLMFTLHCQPTRNQVDVIKEWLERSKPFPLNIRAFFLEVDGHPKTRYEQPQNPRHSFTDLTLLFDEHSARWKTLSIQSPSWVSTELRGNPDGVPLLKTLQLLFFDSEDSSPNFCFRGVKPQPTRVDVEGYACLGTLAISWENVTHATLALLCLDSYVQLLQNAPRLVNLRLERAMLSYKRPTQIAATPYIHDKLRVLYISPCYLYFDAKAEYFYSLIFERVTLPSLEDLTLYDLESIPLDKFKQFYERCSSPLETLYIKYECVQQEAVDLLYSLPPSTKNIKLDLLKPSEIDLDIKNLFDHLVCAPEVTEGMPQRPEILPKLVCFEMFLDKEAPPTIPWNRLPNLRRPLSGKPLRPDLEVIALYPRRSARQSGSRPFLDKSRGIIDESDVRGLIGLLEDDVDLYLPDKVSREDLLAMLETQSV